jgi:hypothetical protein
MQKKEVVSSEKKEIKKEILPFHFIQAVFSLLRKYV